MKARANDWKPEILPRRLPQPKRTAKKMRDLLSFQSRQAPAQGRSAIEILSFQSLNLMVGLVRFELTTSCTPCKRATRLRYSPNKRTVNKTRRSRRRKSFFEATQTSIAAACYRPRVQQ